MIQKYARGAAAVLTSACLVLSSAGPAWADRRSEADSYQTTTPIKHVVVIFQENVSFDHYFATCPHATNPTGEPAFHARHDTPRVNNLLAGGLLDENPNSAQPFRLDLTQAVTCDQDHDYGDEQKAHNHGLMDKFRCWRSRLCGLWPWARPGDGLLRWQYGHRGVELRPVFCHERQLLRNYFRTINPRRAEPHCRKYRRRNSNQRKS